MLGITRIPTGGMGNRLFHYHFLRQIAKKMDIGYFHPRLPDFIYFEGMGRKRRPLFRFRSSLELTSKEVLSFEPAGFLSFVEDETSKGRDIVFSPPMLGEVFFDYLFCDPNEFLKVKAKYAVGLERCAQAVSAPRYRYHETRLRNAFYRFDFRTWETASVDLIVLDGPNGNGRSLAFPFLGNAIRLPCWVLIDDYLDYPFVDDLEQIVVGDVVRRVHTDNKEYVFIKVTGKQEAESS